MTQARISTLTVTKLTIQVNHHTVAPSVTQVVVHHSHAVADVDEAVVIRVVSDEVDGAADLAIKHRTRVHAIVAEWQTTMPTAAISS